MLMRLLFLHYSTSTCDAVDVVLGELFTPDIEGVKSIRSVRAVFEKFLFRFGILFIVLVLAKPKPATIYLRRLNCKNQVVIVLTVEHRCK